MPQVVEAEPELFHVTIQVMLRSGMFSAPPTPVSGCHVVAYPHCCRNNEKRYWTKRHDAMAHLE